MPSSSKHIVSGIAEYVGTWIEIFIDTVTEAP